MGFQKPPFLLTACPFFLGCAFFLMFPANSPYWMRVTGLPAGYALGFSILYLFHSTNARYIIQFLLPLEVEVSEDVANELSPRPETRKIPGEKNVICKLELELQAVLIHPPIAGVEYSFPLPNGEMAIARTKSVRCKVDKSVTEFTVVCERAVWSDRVFTSKTELERGVRSLVRHGWQSAWTTPQESRFFKPEFDDTFPVQLRDVA